MVEADKLYVHVRELKTRDIVKSIEFTEALTQRNLDRVEAGMLRHLDLDKHFIDTVVVEMAIRRKNR